MIRRKISQFKTLFLDATIFAQLRLDRSPKNKPALLVNFKNPQLYHRFFYVLLKFYKLAGYDIYFPMDFATFRNIRNKDRYLSLILREKNFLFIDRKNIPSKYLEINDDMFSADYFLSYFEDNNQEECAFHIPMSFHPYMYHRKLWDISVDVMKTRYNAVFCYGNFDSEAYLAIKKTGFKVLPRTQILKYFKTKKEFVQVYNKEDIVSKDSLNLHKKFVFAIKENYAIEMPDVRELLSFFNFYLCCPGVVMPLCHNIIEAMSVGTIPLIEKEYAGVMYPNLQHKLNAIVFDDLQHLEQILEEEIFKFSQLEVEDMKKNVLKYYDDFLAPKSVVERINDSISTHKKIFLQAEHRSIKFIHS